MRIAAAVLPLIVCSLSVLSSSIHHSTRRTGEGVRIRSASLDASRLKKGFHVTRDLRFGHTAFVGRVDTIDPHQIGEGLDDGMLVHV